MSSAPKIKPVKAGEQKRPAQTAMGEADTSTPSLFQLAMWAARALWMGPPDGELGEIGELEKETWACESSTEEAIRSAEPTKKLSALRQGVDELQEKLCASATRYYNECFELALRNRAELDATLSVVAAELGYASHISNPAEFARGWTTGDLSTFLGVTALDGKEKAQEIGSDGRVREFIRHVCGDYSDVLVVDPEAEQNKVFLLPRWPIGRTVGARMAQRWKETNPARSPFEETEEFILGTEEILIKNLRRAIAHAHRSALVKQASVIETESQVLAILSDNAQHTATRPILDGKTLLIPPWDSGKDSAEEFDEKQRNSTRTHRKAYPRSAVKRHIQNYLTNDPKASAREVCAHLDEQDVDDIPSSWLKNGNRELSAAYRDKEVRPKIDSMISKVKRALSENLDKRAFYAAFWKATNSVFVTAKRCAFSSR